MPRYSLEIPLMMFVTVDTDAFDDADDEPDEPPTEEESFAEADRLADVAVDELLELTSQMSWTENLLGIDAERIEGWSLTDHGEVVIRPAIGGYL
jgi:hypothetical protein